VTDEAQILSRCLKGDPEAWNEIFDRHYVACGRFVAPLSPTLTAEDIEEIETKNLVHTFEVNIFSMFWLTKAALKHMAEGSVIINSTSVTAYKGSPELLDYSATKGAITAFTRSLSQNLVKRKIRVNGVAPGPIWTPLIPASFDKKRTSEHGKNAPMKRAGQPVEVAYSYLFLATEESSYFTGQILHPNGGTIVNA